MPRGLRTSRGGGSGSQRDAPSLWFLCESKKERRPTRISSHGHSRPYGYRGLRAAVKRGFRGQKEVKAGRPGLRGSGELGSGELPARAAITRRRSWLVSAAALVAAEAALVAAEAAFVAADVPPKPPSSPPTSSPKPSPKPPMSLSSPTSSPRQPRRTRARWSPRPQPRRPCPLHR